MKKNKSKNNFLNKLSLSFYLDLDKDMNKKMLELGNSFEEIVKILSSRKKN